MTDTTSNVVDINTAAKGGPAVTTTTKTTKAKTTKKRSTRKARASKKPAIKFDGSGAELGSFVWYDVEGCSITHADLMQVFAEEKLDKKYAPKAKIRGENALKKVRQRINGRRQSLAVMVDEIDLGDDRVLYGVVDPAVDKSNVELQYKHAITIELDKANDTLKITNRLKNANAKIGNTTCGELIQQVHDMYAEFCGHLISRDITRMVVRAFKMMNVVSLRYGGGLYWIAPKHKADVTALRGVFNRISDKPMTLTTITDTNGNRNELISKAKERTSDKITKLGKAVADFQERMRLGDITAKSMETKIVEFKTLRDEVQVLTDALQFNADDLLKGIKSAEDGVFKMIDQFGEEKKKKEEAPKKETAKAANS